MARCSPSLKKERPQPIIFLPRLTCSKKRARTHLSEGVREQADQGCDQEDIGQGHKDELRGISRPQAHARARRLTITGGPKYGDLFAALAKEPYTSLRVGYISCATS